jgi:Tfp pilus assembly protein PilO
MSLSERDRKIALAIVPILLLAVYWFLLLAPKREAASTASTDLSEQTVRLDKARAAAQASEGAKTDFAADYAEIVRLGKAIPAGVDMPSLVVQLDRAAEGTGIRFTRIAMGQRDTPAPAPAPTPPPASGSGQGDTSNGSTAVQAGGDTAQSAPGGAVEAANNTSAQQSQAAQAADQSGVASSDTQTSTSSGTGLPVGGGAATGTGATAGAASSTGLDTIPLELEFVGNFFNLSDFFHDTKRFVRVANNNILVSGRLISIEGVKFESDPQIFPRIKAELKATVYLSPKVEGATAGATAQGPATTPASTTTTPSSTPTAPTATVTP